MTLRSELLADMTELLHTRCGVDPAVLSEGTGLFDELGLDSLDLIATAQALQSKYVVSLDNESITSVRTIGDVLTFVEESIASAARTAHDSKG